MKWFRIKALLLKYWYVTRQDLARLLDLFYWAILNMIMFGFTTLFLVQQTNNPSIAVYLIGGIILWFIFLRAQFDACVYFLEEFWSYNDKNLFVTPLRTSEIVTALGIFAAIRALFTAVITAAFAYILYYFSIYGGSILAVLYILPIIIFGWAIGVFALGLIFRYGRTIQVITWSITLFFQPFSASYYPVSVLPHWMQIVAHGLPLVYAFEGYRSAYAGQFSIFNLVVGILLALVYLVLGSWYLASSIDKSKTNGKLTDY